MVTKQCARCGEMKPETAYPASKRDLKWTNCTKCCTAVTNNRRAARAEYQHQQALRYAKQELG